jgi:hypothetical protein
VRSLALCLGYIPAAENFCLLSRAELDQVIVENKRFSCDWLLPAYSEGARGVRYVRGTREKFPADGPVSKYAALFDKRTCFNALRYAFLVGADPLSTTKRFSEELTDLLQNVVLDGTQNLKTITTASEFLHHVERFATEFVLPGPPANFSQTAWPAYLQAIQNEDYYFSVDEVLLISAMAERNVIIFQSSVASYILPVPRSMTKAQSYL